MIAYKTFLVVPADKKPAGIPDNWPYTTVQCDICRQAEFEAQGFTVVDEQTYTSYLAANQAAYDAWLAGYQASLNYNIGTQRTTIEQNKAFANQLISDVKGLNIISGAGVAQGLWAHKRFANLTITFTQAHADTFAPLQPLVGLTLDIDLINLIVTGDCESAYGVFCCIEPDDMTQPYHCITQQLIDYVKMRIATYLGWA